MGGGLLKPNQRQPCHRCWVAELLYSSNRRNERFDSSVGAAYGNQATKTSVQGLASAPRSSLHHPLPLIRRLCMKEPIENARGTCICHLSKPGSQKQGARQVLCLSHQNSRWIRVVTFYPTSGLFHHFLCLLSLTALGLPKSNCNRNFSTTHKTTEIFDLAPTGNPPGPDDEGAKDNEREKKS